MLLYASFNDDALSDRFIFTNCSKYTPALVHSCLIGWGLIWFFPALGDGGTKTTKNCHDFVWLGSRATDLLLGLRGSALCPCAMSTDISVLCLGPGNHLEGPRSECFIFLLGKLSSGSGGLFACQDGLSSCPFDKLFYQRTHYHERRTYSSVFCSLRRQMVEPVCGLMSHC